MRKSEMQYYGKVVCNFLQKVLAKNIGWTATEKQGIEDELDRTAELCDTEYASDTPLISENENLKLEIIALKQSIRTELENVRLSKITEIKRTPTEHKGEYILDYIINDQEKYDEKIMEIANLIKTSDFSYDQLYR